MKDWERAEDLIRRFSGGKLTIGSGNKHEKGDVITENWTIESKQTNKPYLDIKREWLEKLDRENNVGKDLAIVFFIANQEIVPYYFQPFNPFSDETVNITERQWKTLRVTTDTFPDVLYSSSGKWVKDSLESLKDLF